MTIEIITEYFTRYGAIAIFVIVLLESSRSDHASCRNLGSQGEY